MTTAPINHKSSPHPKHLAVSKLAESSSDRFILEPECKAITALSRQRRWELEREGRFPKRVKLGERTNAWRLSELQAWMESATASRAV